MSEAGATGAVTAPVLKEFRHEYQPVDSQGNPMGGVQVLKYSAEAPLSASHPLLKAMENQYNNVLERLRTELKTSRTQSEAPQGAEPLGELVQFQKRPLTVEERFQLSQDLNDPAKNEEAMDRLFESRTGVKPETLNEVLNKQQRQGIIIEAQSSYNTFVTQHPEFGNTQGNLDALSNWIWNRNLRPSLSNFYLAYSELQKGGFPFAAPAVRQETIRPAVQAIPEPQATVEAKAQSEPSAQPAASDSAARVSAPLRQSLVPSGLNGRTTSTEGVQALDGNSMTSADLDRMTADQYKKFASTREGLATIARIDREERAKGKNPPPPEKI
jgi:hypothetical protein